jgi:hypothetical protein
MNLQNLPKVVEVRTEHTCYTCGKKIKKGNCAVYHWWVVPKSKAYDHVGCHGKTKKQGMTTPL